MIDCALFDFNLLSFSFIFRFTLNLLYHHVHGLCSPHFKRLPSICAILISTSLCMFHKIHNLTFNTTETACTAEMYTTLFCHSTWGAQLVMTWGENSVSLVIIQIT